VPFRLPRSSSRIPSVPRVSTAWLRETVTSSRKMSLEGERPTVDRAASSGKS
jgi:hypothetical protein